jgi:hypothetical protein
MLVRNEPSVYQLANVCISLLRRGKEKWEKVKDSTVLCSGTSMGTKIGMHRYFDRMLKEIAERVTYEDKANCEGWFGDKCDCRTGGVDQGYHNYLFHSGEFGPNAIAIPNLEGIVLTVGFMCAAPEYFNSSAGVLAKTVDKEGLATTGDGVTTAAVVHQHDRCRPQPRGWR